MGGYNRHRTRPAPFPDCDVTTAKGLIDFISILIHDTWKLGDSVGRARALCNMTQLQSELVNFRDTSKWRAMRKRDQQEKLKNEYEMAKIHLAVTEAESQVKAMKRNGTLG